MGISEKVRRGAVDFMGAGGMARAAIHGRPDLTNRPRRPPPIHRGEPMTAAADRDLGAGRRARHILGLDLIRFSAAALVTMLHYGHRGRATDIPFAWTGWVGVEVFFV